MQDEASDGLQALLGQDTQSEAVPGGWENHKLVLHQQNEEGESCYNAVSCKRNSGSHVYKKQKKSFWMNQNDQIALKIQS